MTEEQPPSLRPGWTRLPHAHVARPTFYPAGLALGATFVFWSLVTSVVVLAVGVCVFAVSLAGWIYEIRHERKQR